MSTSPALTPCRDTLSGCFECPRDWHDIESSGGITKNADKDCRDLPVPGSETAGAVRDLPAFELSALPSPTLPASARLPTVPIFDGPDSDLPDILDLSIWGDEGLSSGAHPPRTNQGQAVLDHSRVDLTDCGNDSQDTSFASNTTDSTDTSSDMSFGPFTPSASNTGIGLRARGVGLGIFGLDFGPAFQPTFADTASVGTCKKRPDHVVVTPEVYGSGVTFTPNSPTDPSFGLDEGLPFSPGPALTAIPECDSWRELADALCSSALPRPDGLDSADTTFSSNYEDSTNGEGSDSSYGLDLSFSFPAQRLPSLSDAEHSTPPRRRRSGTTTFSSPTISSDLKRALSFGSRVNYTPRVLLQHSPTITSISSSEVPRRFEITDALPSDLWSRASCPSSPPSGDVLGRGHEGPIVPGRGDQRNAVGAVPQSPAGRPRSSHRRWRM